MGWEAEAGGERAGEKSSGSESQQGVGSLVAKRRREAPEWRVPEQPYIWTASDRTQKGPAAGDCVAAGAGPGPKQGCGGGGRMKRCLGSKLGGYGAMPGGEEQREEGDLCLGTSTREASHTEVIRLWAHCYLGSRSALRCRRHDGRWIGTVPSKPSASTFHLARSLGRTESLLWPLTGHLS